MWFNLSEYQLHSMRKAYNVVKAQHLCTAQLTSTFTIQKFYYHEENESKILLFCLNINLLI